MANLVAGGLKSLAAHRDTEGADSNKIRTAWGEVDGLKLKQHPKPSRIVAFSDFRKLANILETNVTQTKDAESKSSEIADLNMLDLDERRCKNLSHLIGVCIDVEAQYDFNAVVGMMKNNDYDHLPAPLGPRSPFAVGYTMQLVVLDAHEPGRYVILKHYNFVKTQKTRCVVEKMKHENELFFVLDKCPDWYQSCCDHVGRFWSGGKTS